MKAGVSLSEVQSVFSSTDDDPILLKSETNETQQEIYPVRRRKKKTRGQNELTGRSTVRTAGDVAGEQIVCNEDDNERSETKKIREQEVIDEDELQEVQWRNDEDEVPEEDDTGRRQQSAEIFSWKIGRDRGVSLGDIQNEVSYCEYESAPSEDSVLVKLENADTRHWKSVSPYPEPKMAVLTLGAAFFTGAMFGFAFEKSRVYEPYTIIDQFLFKRFLMFKMFFAALGVSFAIVACGPPKVIARLRIWGQKNSLPVFRSCLPGGYLLGAGMAMAGACPGMVLVQVGANVSSGIYTFFGGLVGAAVFGIIHPLFDDFLKGGYAIVGTWDQLFGVNYRKVCIVLSIFCCLGSFLLEYVASWDDETGYKNGSGIGAIAWPPQIGGVIVGLCQIPLIACLGRTLGASSAYMNITSVCCLMVMPRLKPKFPYWTAYMSLFWWQSIFALGAMGGAALSAWSSDSFGRAEGVPLWRSLTGGFIMIIGARLGGGCTSGHGISGISLLMNTSVIVVMGMFAGCFSVAFLIFGFEHRHL